ncbi:unnamed protein product [Urochloa humidicola]
MESPYSDYFGIIWKIIAKIATVVVVIPSTYSYSNQRCRAKGHEANTNHSTTVVPPYYTAGPTSYIQDLYKDLDVVREAFEEQDCKKKWNRCGPHGTCRQTGAPLSMDTTLIAPLILTTMKLWFMAYDEPLF